MADRLPIQVYNHISERGLSRLPAERYRVGKDVAHPVAIVLRSADLHQADIPPSVRAIARAGAGTNNIPVDAMSARGVPVFNAPGANANAVKELVLAGMLMAARQIAPALRFVDGLDPAALGLAARDGEVRAALAAELARKLRDDPSCDRARGGASPPQTSRCSWRRSRRRSGRASGCRRSRPARPPS